MPDIKWNVAVQIAGGPSLARSASVAVDAYDKIEVTVPAGEQNLEVQVAPANADIRFLMLTATPVGDDPLDASYRVNDVAADEHALDSPLLLLIGAGAVGLMGAVPRSFFLTNNSGTQDVAVEILVGRDPTP
jgi:hypothetical protein